MAGSLETGRGSPGSEGAPLSLAEIRRQNDQQDAAKQEEALAYFTKAEEYRTAGKMGLAKLNYQRAAARDAGKVKEAALKRISQLQNPPAVTAKTQGGEKER